MGKPGRSHAAQFMSGPLLANALPEKFDNMLAQPYQIDGDTAQGETPGMDARNVEQVAYQHFEMRHLFHNGGQILLLALWRHDNCFLPLLQNDGLADGRIRLQESDVALDGGQREEA